MKQNEIKSLEEGNLLLFDITGKPSFDASCIWFVWYLEDDEYKVLLKTFNTIEGKVEKSLEKIRNVFVESGLGRLDLMTGKWLFFKPERNKL